MTEPKTGWQCQCFWCGLGRFLGLVAAVGLTILALTSIAKEAGRIADALEAHP